MFEKLVEKYIVVIAGNPAFIDYINGQKKIFEGVRQALDGRCPRDAGERKEEIGTRHSAYLQELAQDMYLQIEKMLISEQQSQAARRKASREFPQLRRVLLVLLLVFSLLQLLIMGLMVLKPAWLPPI